MAITPPTPGQSNWDVPLNLALTTLDSGVTTAQTDAADAEAAALAAAADADAAEAAAADAAADAAAAAAAVTGKIDATITRTAAGSTIQTINLNYTTNVSDPDLIQVKQNGTLLAWHNENGHYRARVSENNKSDSPCRIIQVSGQTGNPFEYENVARTTRIWSIDPNDGATKRFDVKMADVLVLGSGDPIPGATPAGTIIMRTA